MVADSSQYTPETLARRRAMAEALFKGAGGQIRHPAQLAGELAQAAVGAYGMRKAEDEEKKGRSAAMSEVEALLGTASPSPVNSMPGAFSPPPSTNTPGVMENSPQSSNPNAVFQNAISSIESGGKYDILGPVTKTGDRAYGKYQIMGNNIPQWSQAALGRSVTPQEFLSNPQLQDQIFNHRFGQYAQKYGPEGAAKAWFAGEGGMNNPNAKDQLGTSVQKYGQRFMQALGPQASIPPQTMNDAGPQPQSQMSPREQIAQVLAGSQQMPDTFSPPQITPPPGMQQAQSQSVPGQQQYDKAALAKLLTNPYTPPAVQALVLQRLAPKDTPLAKIGQDQFGNDQYGWVDARNQRVIPVQIPGAPQQSGPATVMGPGGKEIPIPAGVDPKQFRKDVTSATADAATGKMTEVQANSTQFANRMELAEKNLTGVDTQGTATGNKVLDMLPFGNFGKKPEAQQFDQAKKQFITALLRKESGAAIAPSEFDRYDKEFFPQPGDDPKVVTQKREARQVAIDAMKKGAGPGYTSPNSSTSIPQGVDPKIWNVMTPEERALWN